MNKFFTLFLILLLSLSLFASEIITTKLPNGMQVAVKKTTDTNVALYIFIKTGSVHEGKFLGSGISHYLEHVISGGSTQYKTEEEYQAIMQSIGAARNASTGYDMTNYHIVVDVEYIDTALETLAEWIMHCSFDHAEVEREKQVILKEIIMRKTPPMSQVVQRYMEVANSSTHYRYPIIGYTENLERLTRDDLIEYYLNRYTPHNMIFVAVGGFEDTNEMLDKIATTFQDFSRPPAPEVYLPKQTPPLATYTVMDEFDIERALVYMERPVDNPDDFFATRLAANILFGKRSSPIAHYFEEETKLVNSISAHARGNLLIAFEPNEVDDIERIISLLDEKLNEYLRPKKITQKMINDEIKSMQASQHLRRTSPQVEARNIGYSILEYNIPDFITNVPLTELNKVTVTDIQRVIKDHFLGNKIIFCALPRGTISALPGGRSRGGLSDITKSPIQKHTLNNRLTLLHKYSNEKPIVRASIRIPASTLYEDETNIGTLEFMSYLLFEGSKKYPTMALSDWLEDRAISLRASVGVNGFTISFSCLADDLDPLVDRIIDALTSPLYAPEEIELMKSRLYSSVMRYSSYPQYLHSDFVNTKIYKNPRDQMSYIDKFTIGSELTRADLLATHKKFITADKIIMSFFGDIDETKAKRVANQISSKIPNKAVDGVKTPIEIAISDSVYINVYPHDQVNISIYTHAPTIIERDDFIVMETIEKILGSGGMRGRIFNATRRDNDLVYFAMARYEYTSSYALFYLESQTSMEKKDDLIAVLLGELHKLKTEPVTPKEINDAVLDFSKTIKNYMTEDTLVRLALGNEFMGLGYDYDETSIIEMQRVTPEDIIRVANKYFDKYDVIVSQPEE